MTNNNSTAPTLATVGRYLEKLAKSNNKTLRQIAKDTNLSINSIKVVFSGLPGNTKTYSRVAEYLGTTFIQAVIESCSSIRTVQSGDTVDLSSIVPGTTLVFTDSDNDSNTSSSN